MKRKKIRSKKQGIKRKTSEGKGNKGNNKRKQTKRKLKRGRGR